MTPEEVLRRKYEATLFSTSPFRAGLGAVKGDNRISVHFAKGLAGAALEHELGSTGNDVDQTSALQRAIEQSRARGYR